MTKPEISPRAVARLMAHAWPGNGRELMNTLEALTEYIPRD